MKVQCPCCYALVEIDDTDVRSYVGSLMGSGCSDVKKAALRLNASKPRPGARGKKKVRISHKQGDRNE